MGELEVIEAEQQAHSRSLTKRLYDRIKLVEAYKPWAVAVGVAGAVVAALSRLDLGSVGLAMAIGGAVAAALAGLAAAFLDYRKLEIGTDLRDVEDRLARAIEVGKRIDSDVGQNRQRLEGAIKAEQVASIERAQHRQSMLLALLAMQRAGERAGRDQSITQVIETMLDVSMSDLMDAFAFDPREHWTFSVFARRRAAGGEILRREVARWWDRAAELRPARTWRRGEGYTGYAWLNRIEVIESDTRDPEAARLYKVPDEKQLPGDLNHYVSVASIPILIGPRDRVWGVITVTSNKAGRFQRDPTDLRSLNVDIVRQIERIIAVQVALREPPVD